MVSMSNRVYKMSEFGRTDMDFVRIYARNLRTYNVIKINDNYEKGEEYCERK